MLLHGLSAFPSFPGDGDDAEAVRRAGSARTADQAETVQYGRREQVAAVSVAAE